jgi:hypothetical protein
VPPGLSGGIGSMAAHSQSASSWRMNRRLRFWGVETQASDQMQRFQLGPCFHAFGAKRTLPRRPPS